MPESQPLGRSVSPTWRVKAWVTAPGDFPSQSIHIVTVTALDASAAIRAAVRTEAFILDPIVVSVERIRPPANIEPGVIP